MTFPLGNIMVCDFRNSFIILTNFVYDNISGLTVLRQSCFFYIFYSFFAFSVRLSVRVYVPRFIDTTPTKL